MGLSTYAEQIDALTLATGVGGKLATAKVALIKEPFVPSRTLAVADVTLADYGGYAPVSVAAWTDPYVDPAGFVTADGGDILFKPTDALTPNTIYGWMLTDAAGTGVLYSELLAEPVNLLNTLTGLVVDVTFTYGN